MYMYYQNLITSLHRHFKILSRENLLLDRMLTSFIFEHFSGEGPHYIATPNAYFICFSVNKNMFKPTIMTI